MVSRLKLSDNVLRSWGGGPDFPPHFRFRAQINSSSPIELKIELCTYQSHPDTTRKNILHRTCSETPLERFLAVGDQNGVKVRSEKNPKHRKRDIVKYTRQKRPIPRGLVLLVCSTSISIFSTRPNEVCANLFWADKNLIRTS